MTEKRFTLFGLDNETIKDDVTKECYWVNEYVQRKKLVGLLNKLYEENEKLRFLIDINSLSERRKLERQVDEQQATIDKLRVDIRATRTTIRKLQDLCGESDGENAKLRIENKRLEEDNEQLQKELKELENNYKDLLYDGGFDE